MKSNSYELHVLERLAINISKKIGILEFFGIIFLWSLLWLGWNSLAPAPFQIDPETVFIIWLFICNIIQIIFLPIITIGQKLIEVAQRNADNQKDRDEIHQILECLNSQNKLLISMNDAIYKLQK